MNGIIIAALIGAVVLPIAIACVYGFQLHDRDRREREGLPPRKYRDTDGSDDVHIFFSIHDK